MLIVVVFLLFELEIPFMSHPLDLPLRKQATSELQGNLYTIFAVVHVEATQKFIYPQYLKFALPVEQSGQLEAKSWNGCILTRA